MALYGSVFTAIYDPLLAWGERAGMRELRRTVLADATGEILELGAGTGLNLAVYPTGAGKLVLTEPEPSMVRRLRDTDGDHTVIASGPEDLPFDDASFDTVVSTLVLCTVDDPDRALREVRRVLRPGGALLLIEHVRSSRPRLAALQDGLHRPWRGIGYGCNCNRDTAGALERADFDTTNLRTARWRRMPVIVAPLVVGAVTPRG